MLHIVAGVAVLLVYFKLLFKKNMNISNII